MISILSPENDPEDIEDALEEMAELGASTIAVAIKGEDAVVATAFDLERTEAILAQIVQIIRMARAN